MRVFRCGQGESGVAAAGGGGQAQGSAGRAFPCSVCIQSLFAVSTACALLPQTLPSLSGLVSLTQLKAEVALWGHPGDLLMPDPAALMWPQSAALAASSGAAGTAFTSDHKRAAAHSSFQQTHCHTHKKGKKTTTQSKTNNSSSYFPHTFFSLSPCLELQCKMYSIPCSTC